MLSLQRPSLYRHLERAITRTQSRRNVSTHPQLAGKKCIITGASRGIGLAIAQRFAHEGALCTLVGRNLDTLNSTASSLSNDNHIKHVVKVGNVAKRDFWVELGKECKDVDILVNAAGVTHASLLMVTRPESVEEVIQTNLMGTIWSSQIIVKNMTRRKTGCIINVSSLLGLKGGRGSTVYAASKAGVLGFTRSLAAEVGSTGIRVNAIVPGYIDTPMTDAMDHSARHQAINSIPQNRFGNAEDVADAAVFLATNPYANNCVLNLDGGLSAM